jgi:tetratricopeptide (TPR) repeat protein
MARPFDAAPPPGASVLGRIGSSTPPATAAELIMGVSPADSVLEDYRPLPLNLEWRLSELHWIREGVAPFIRNDVPYHANNNGRASADAALVLFSSCLDVPPGDDPVLVLEVGAGSALFARYFLDEFRDLCRRHDRDFYDRLRFHVTDRSPGSVRHWLEREVFGEHGGRVTTGVCDAQSLEPVEGPLRAVFANYVLDSLPAAVLRRTGDGWQQLCARALIRDDDGAANSPRVGGMRKAARPGPLDDLGTLLPLLPILDSELAFLPIEGNGPPGWEHHLGAIDDETATAGLIYNYGALRCLDQLVTRLHPAGFILVRDYGSSSGGGAPRSVGAQRFGGATALPLNFDLIARHLRARSVEMLDPGDEGPMHTRLLVRAPLSSARRTFAEQFGARTPDAWALQSRAREQAGLGLIREALDIYRHAIAIHPRDWQLIGEAAQLAATQLRDPATGLELARAALRLNPWYSPFLWNVLGDCLAALDRPDEAHGCYEEARRLHPGGVETHVRLAASWLRLGEAGRSLESVAHGLAADADAMCRHTLLDTQQAAITALSRGWIARREASFRRDAREAALVSERRTETDPG